MRFLPGQKRRLIPLVKKGPIKGGEKQTQGSSFQKQYHWRKRAYQVEEHGDPLHGSVLLKVPLEELSCLHVHTHGSKNDGKLVRHIVLYRKVKLTTWFWILTESAPPSLDA
jgi:hypothetical protein